MLSAVLILTAFLAIISGALMTELSTNFLLSNALVNRVGTEATVNAAMELALDQLQNTALTKGCPGALSATPLPGPVTLNGRTAAVSYLSCWPTVDARSPQFKSIPLSAPFSIDGTHSVIPGSQDFYLVGDSGGMVSQFAFGKSSPNWTKDMGSAITGPPLAMQDGAIDPKLGKTDPQDIANLVPIAGGGDPGCTANACVELLGQDTNLPAPDVSCFMTASAAVTTRPAAGINYPQIAYFGDSGGTLYANTATEFSCAQRASQTNSVNAPIVAGPIVFQNSNGNSDEVYVVTSKGSTSQLLRYTYRSGSLSLADTQPLPFSNPVGLAVEKTSAGVELTGGPAHVAITFAGGGVAVALIDSKYDPKIVATTGLGMTITGAPSWCSCPGGPQIGAAGDNGKLYVLDANLGTIASYSAGSPIRTAPASDSVGEWFFGADDGYLYELQQPSGSPPVTMVRVARYGPVGGSVRGSVQVGGCPTGICVYIGSTNSDAYIVPLDARDAKITACLSSSPPACSGVNPRLWAQVEVGAAGTPQIVHVRGWSYYSP